MKRILSLFLTACMIVGLVVLPVSAAGEGFRISVNDGQVRVGEGQSVTVDVVVENNPGMYALTLDVYYKTDRLVCTSAATPQNSGWTITATADSGANDRADESYKMARFGAFALEGFTANGVIGSLTFTALEDLESCETELLVVAKKITGAGNANITDTVTTGNSTITIQGVAPTLNTVSLVSNAVTVHGGDATAQTVQATATSRMGNNMTSAVQWSVNPAGDGVTVNNEGLISVSAKAKAKTYTITATPDGTNSLGTAKEATLTVTREDAALTRIALDKTSVTVRGGSAQSQTVTATAYDQYDDAITENVTWSMTHGSITEHATDKASMANGIVTVPAKTAAGEYTISATVDSVTKSATLTVVRADEQATQVVISGGAEEINVPGNGAAAATSAPFTAAVTDQFDGNYTGNVVWTISPTVAGVSLGSNGVVTVTNEAKAAITNTEGRAFTVTATCGEAADTATITVKRAESAATTVKIFRKGAELGSSDTVVMPVAGGRDKEYIYTAKVYDQYGEEMDGTAVWSAATSTDAAHVVFAEAEGKLTVKAGATKGATITLNVTMNGVSKSLAVTVTDLEVDWSTVTPKGITYGEKNSAAITLPSAGSASAGDLDLAGEFEVMEPNAVQAAGAQSVTVKFTVTTAGDYQGIEVTRDFDVTVAKKPVTVTAENKTKTYGEANPELTFTVPGNALVGNDTESDLGVTLRCAATETSPAGTPVDITGTATSVNYNVTVQSGKLTINKATISGVTTTAADKTILANAAENTDLDALTASMRLPTKATVTFGADKTEELNVTWTVDKAFSKKGATYIFTGKVTVGTNFNTTDKTDTATLTVTPVRITAIQTVPASLTASKAQVLAEDASLTALGLPEQVTLTYSGGVEAEQIDATFDKDIAAVKAVANQVTAAADKTVELTLTTDNFHDWATLDTALPKTVLTITNKYVIPDADISFDNISTTFGADYTPVATVANKPEYEGVTYTYAYADKDGETVAKPVNAGTYTMTVTVENDSYKGTKSAELVIVPKTIAEAIVTLPEGFSAVYNKAAHTPEVTVTDGESVLVKDEDYTVSYADNVDAGTATITVTGKGNYDHTTTATKTFEIAKGSIAELTPTITGVAEAGKVLTAQLAGVDNSELNWTWTVGGVAVTGNPYTVQPTDSNKPIVVKAVAKEVNYTGATLDSETVTVAKVTISGTVTIELTTDVDSDGVINVGDTVTATATVVPDVDVSYQWYNDGTIIEGATDEVYTVAEGDTELTVAATPGEDYDGSITSVSIEVGKSVLAGTVTVSGSTEVGGVLTATIAADPATAEDYKVAWLRNGEAIPGAADTTYTVAKEDQGKAISVKVTATGNTYTGELVSAATPIPAARPDAPAVRASAGNQQVVVSWTAPADNGSPITGYTVQMNEETAISVEAGQTRYTFTGLENGTEYTFKVVAVNAIGSSEAGTAVAAPKAPSGGFGGGTAPAPSVNVSIDGAGNVTATAPATEGRDGGYTTTISASDGKKIVDAASKTEGSSVVIAPEVKEDAGKVTVNMPVSTVSGLVDSKTEDVTVKTPVADVVLEPETLAALAEAAKQTVNVTAEKLESGAVAVTVAVDGKTLETVGVTAKLPVDEAAGNGTVAVLVLPDGTEKVIRNSVIVDGKLVTPLDGSATVKIEDRSKKFADMRGHWAQGSVDFASARELFVGTSDTTFAPNQTMSRSMLATVLYRLDGEHKSSVADAFADVSSGTWYTDAVAWAAEKGIVKGYNENTFAPDDNVTREQMVTMLRRYATALGVNTAAKGQSHRFNDEDQVSDWAKDAMAWASGIGLVQGRDNNMLAPTAAITRAEAATLLERFIELTVK